MTENKTKSKKIKLSADIVSTDKLSKDKHSKENFACLETPQKIYILKFLKDVEEIDKTTEALKSDKITEIFKIKAEYKFESMEEAKNYFLEVENNSISEKIIDFFKENVTKNSTLICDISVLPILKLKGIKARENNKTMRILKSNQENIIKEDLYQKILGLSHKISRDKISSVIGKEDNFIVQSIIVIDQLEQDISLYSVRLKELYGWYLPEIERLVSTEQYVKCVEVLMDYRTNTEDEIKKKAELLKLDYEVLANSIGSTISDFDWSVIKNMSAMISKKIENKKNLENYLKTKISNVCPNLSALVGEKCAARLIQLSGSLQNLCSYPPSTLQLLGAEKSLFRSLKAKGPTPKYGILYNTGIVQSTRKKFRGRAARSLASKCSLVSRIDCYSTKKTSEYGKALKKMMSTVVECYGKQKIKIIKTNVVVKEVYDKLQ